MGQAPSRTRKPRTRCGGAVSPALAQRPQGRKLLLTAAEIPPRILLEAAEALAQIEHGILVAAFGAAELLPRHWYRHRSARPGARRVGGHRGLFQRVAQVVDEDLSS